jgi:endonuclease YncB( thermonuclease family)
MPLLALAALAATAPAGAAELHGRATRVFDGDSFLLRLDGGGTVEVRLGEIDAPEKAQPYADESRAALRELILDRDLRLQVIDEDKYGRTVARAYLVGSNLDVNADLVGRGHAWVYRYHLRDRRLLDLERAAREARRGLWALPEAERTPPWKWRREHPPPVRTSTVPSLP